MPQQGEEAARARSLGLAHRDASRIYEDFMIPKYEDVVIPGSEGRRRLRRFPSHRQAIIGLVARERRFLRAAYALADAGLVFGSEPTTQFVPPPVLAARCVAAPDAAPSGSRGGRRRAAVMASASRRQAPCTTSLPSPAAPRIWAQGMLDDGGVVRGPAAGEQESALDRPAQGAARSTAFCFVSESP
jgi:hypothetical protein